MPALLLIAAAAAVLTLVITPGICSVALRLGGVQRPKNQNLRQTLRPCLGGPVLGLSFLGTAVLAALFTPALDDSLRIVFPEWIWVLWGALIIVGVGIVDDIRELCARTKMVFQFLAAVMVVLAGNEVSAVADPFIGAKLDLGGLSTPLTLLWVVGVTNAFNLIDGLDGVAAGVGLIASMTLLAVSLKLGHFNVAVAAAIMAGGLAGFLCYNFPPASVFPGDSGSMLLGYLLSVLFIQGAHEGSVGLMVLVPILALGLPIADTTLAIVRRLMRKPRRGPSGSRRPGWIERLASIFHADRDHIHHRLINRGLSPRQAVLVLYSASVALSGLAYCTIELRGIWNVLLLGLVVMGAVVGLKKLGYGQIFRERTATAGKANGTID